MDEERTEKGAEEGVTLEFSDSSGERERTRVYRLTVRRPGKINVLGQALVEELNEALRRVADDPLAAVVVLTGGGSRAFLGGADIRELARLDRDSAGHFIRRLHQACEAIRSLDLPVVARIDGYCLGAGLEIAASCDLRVASEGSTFGMPEVLVGVPSVIEAALLPRLIGMGATSDLVLTGRVVNASEARSMGLVDRVTSRQGLDAEIDEVTRSLLAGAPRALALQKQLLRDWQELPLSEAIEAGIASFELAYETDEPSRYQERFLSRRR